MQKYPISSYTSFWGTGKGGLEDSILGLFLRVCVSWKTKMVRQPPGLFFFTFLQEQGQMSGCTARQQLSCSSQRMRLQPQQSTRRWKLLQPTGARGGSKTQPCAAGPVVLTTNPAHLHCQPHLHLQLTEADGCVRRA